MKGTEIVKMATTTTTSDLRAAGWPQSLAQLLADDAMMKVFSAILGPIPRQLVIDALPKLLITGDARTIRSLHTRYGFEPEEIAFALPPGPRTETTTAALECAGVSAHTSASASDISGHISRCVSTAPSDTGLVCSFVKFTSNELRYILARVTRQSTHSVGNVRLMVDVINDRSDVFRQCARRIMQAGQLAVYCSLIKLDTPAPEQTALSVTPAVPAAPTPVFGAPPAALFESPQTVLRGSSTQFGDERASDAKRTKTTD